MKKLKVGDSELAKILINKMTENHDIDYDFIMENQHENGIGWLLLMDTRRIRL